jgi:hypothetical protein
MNPFVSKLLNDDFVWDAVVSYLPTGSRRSNTDFLKFNCPMCVTRGETMDKKNRGGAKRSSEGLGISCFNCGFASRYVPGQLLSNNFKNFMRALGMPDLEVSRLNHKAFMLSRVVEDSNTEPQYRGEAAFAPAFPPVSLPPDTLPLMDWADAGCDDPDFIAVVGYALDRGQGIADKAMWTPEPEWRQRMIIPFHFRDSVVGWTGRFIHEATEAEPKYMSQVPTDFLYNNRVMDLRDRRFLLMPEGVLDADAVDGISPLGAKLSPRQARWIKDSGKTVIVIPDRDKSGQRLIDSALEHGWHVAFPRLSRGGNNWWEEDCKDCAEAVKRYGRLYTLRSIIETASASRLEIEVRRKWLI